MSARHKIIKSILNGVYFSGMQRFSAPFTAGMGAILMLHHVRPSKWQAFSPNAHLTVTPEFLDKTITWLRKRKIDIISMDEVAERLNEPEKFRTARRFVALTFDDAYRDNLENAVPVLEKHDVPYTIFVATGLVDGVTSIWWESIEELIRQQDYLVLATSDGTIELDCKGVEQKNESYTTLVAHLLEDLDEAGQREKINELAWLYKIDLEGHRASEIMNWNELRALSGKPNCTLGAHSIHHFSLARLSAEESAKEMRESAKVLEAATGVETRHFAYPYGGNAAAGPREFQQANELGFLTGVTTRSGVTYKEHGSHLTALPRISLNGNFQRPRYTKSLISGFPTLSMNGFNRLDVN